MIGSGLFGLGFLKAFLPDSLIKIDNSRKIIVSKNKIIVGGNEIDDPEVIKKFLDKIASYKKSNSLPFQLIHKDLEKDYIQTEEISIRGKDQLKKIREVLPREDVECILMARRVQLAIGGNDRDLIETLLKQLDKKYPDKGRKINNLMSAGYFDELVIPMIDVCKSQDVENYREKFFKFYSDLLRFFPVAIFVNNQANVDWIISEILKRLRLKRIPYIKIHAMGTENIKKVDEALIQFESDNGIVIKNDRFISPELGLKCQNVELKIIKNNY